MLPVRRSWREAAVVVRGEVLVLSKRRGIGIPEERLMVGDMVGLA